MAGIEGGVPFPGHDVGKAPSPAGSVPMPYPNFGQAAPAAGEAAKVKSKEAFMKGASAALQGSDPGTLSGVVSNAIKGSPSFVARALTVMADGKTAAHMGLMSDAEKAEKAKQAPVSGAAPQPLAPDVDPTAQPQ